MTTTTTREAVLADLEERKCQIEAVFGGGIRFEVDWDTFDDSAAKSVDSVAGYPLLRAIQLICREQPGQIEGLRGAFEAIRLVNVASGPRITLLDGVLEIRCDFSRESGPGPGYAEIREVLEKHLPVPSDAFSRFFRSMRIDVEMWRDGTSYDLDALAEMTPGERVMVEKKLLEHLTGSGDWRDVEALAALGAPSALEAVAAAREHGNREVRKRALAYAMEQAHMDEALEGQVVRAVRMGDIHLAERCPTPAVKLALLDCALTADASIRVNAAALLVFLCGLASQPFDWSQRPFFLRFGEHDPARVRDAWRELREKTGL